MGYLVSKKGRPEHKPENMKRKKESLHSPLNVVLIVFSSPGIREQLRRAGTSDSGRIRQLTKGRYMFSGGVVSMSDHLRECELLTWKT